LLTEVLVSLPKNHVCVHHSHAESESKVVIVCNVHLEVDVLGVSSHVELRIQNITKVDVLGRVKTL
jgi:hypothetical protein